jgi:hypothetical protein
MSTKYEQVKSGDYDSWPKVLRIRCCDCGLTHIFKFSREVKRVQIWRDKRATSATRRGLKVKAKIKKLAGSL